MRFREIICIPPSIGKSDTTVARLAELRVEDPTASESFGELLRAAESSEISLGYRTGERLSFHPKKRRGGYCTERQEI